jgi:HTH-type transcriptional regulator/antitoxin HigA
MKTKIDFKHFPKTYEGLLRCHMLRPIHDRVDYENAIEILGAMAGHRLTSDQDDYFEALSLLVEAYEAEHFPALKGKKGLALLKHLLEENDFSAADLSRILGVDRSLGVRILHGERQLTVEHVRKLAKRFRLPIGIFVE